MRVLVVSNLDSKHPFGQFTRPFFLGRGLAAQGIEVGNVAVDPSRVDFGPAWGIGTQSLRALARATRAAIREFRPDVVYAHQNMPATAALLVSGGLPVAADFHALPAVEWSIWAEHASGAERRRFRLRHRRAAAVERFVAGRADLAVAAGAEVAREIVARYAPRREPAVIVNGVDERLLAEAVPPVPPPLAGGGMHAMATLPASAWISNARALDFLREATATLVGEVPEAHVHVLGTPEGPPAAGLHYHPVQDVLPWVAHADACLLPYPAAAGHCGGARNKLLEYLARGRTIVSTVEGLRGLEEVAGWPGVVITDDEPEAYGMAIGRVLVDGEPRLSEDRRLVRDRLRWDRLAQKLAPLLASVAEVDGATSARDQRAAA